MERVAMICRIAIAICLSSPLPAFAQTDFLAAVNSTDWNVRANAVTSISQDQSQLASPTVRSALMALFSRENDTIMQSFKTGPGAADQLGEGFAEYYATSLVPLIEQIADYQNPDHLRILARASYNPDSPYASKLAAAGEPLLPAALELISKGSGPYRWNGASLLGLMMQFHRSGALKQPLSAASLTKGKRALIDHATNDADESVRLWSIRALGMGGDTTDIVTLNNIAAKEGDANGRKLSLQREALRAIDSIKNRPK